MKRLVIKKKEVEKVTEEIPEDRLVSVRQDAADRILEREEGSI